MNVTTEYKTQVLGMLYPQLFEALAGGAEDGNVTADDIMDFFGLGIAAVLDNDSHLKTESQLQHGVLTAALRIEQRTKEFRTMQNQAGVSWLSLKVSTEGDVDGKTVN
jgi:hypothetical protein